MANQLWPTKIVSNRCAGNSQPCRTARRQHLIQASATAGAPARTAHSAPTAKGCTARTTSAGPGEPPLAVLGQHPPQGAGESLGDIGPGLLDRRHRRLDVGLHLLERRVVAGPGE